MDAGVQMTENAGCAACLGGPVDTFGRINKRRHQVHQRDEPQFPRPHGRQGIAGVSRVAGDGGRERVDGQGYRSARTAAEGLMNREALDRWCERGILALVLAILVFGPLAIGATRTLPFLIIQGLTLGVMVLWGARFWLSPRPQLLWPPICWAVVAFVAVRDCPVFQRGHRIRCAAGIDPHPGLCFLFFAILNNLHRQESTLVISCTLVFLAMAISLYAGYQFLTHSNWVWHMYAPHDLPWRSSSPELGAGFWTT